MTKRTTVESVCSLCSTFQSRKSKLHTRSSPYVSKHFDHCALSASKTVLQKKWGKEEEKKKLCNCDTLERKEKSFNEDVHYC